MLSIFYGRSNYLITLQMAGDSKSDSPQPEEDLSEDDLPRIQTEVDELQVQFDASVVVKHQLESELISMNNRLRAASDTIDRFVHCYT